MIGFKLVHEWMNEVSLEDAGNTRHLSSNLPRVTTGDESDHVTVVGSWGTVDLGGGDDVLKVRGEVGRIRAGAGNDLIVIDGEADFIFGGGGRDRVRFKTDITNFDIMVEGNVVTLHDRLTGETMELRSIERFNFNGERFSLEELAEQFDDAATPAMRATGSSRAVVVNDSDPTVSVVWDRLAQAAVMENPGSTGPTVASRVYALVHTAMYDAWASYDAAAVRTSLDVEGDNAGLEAAAVACDAAKAKAMSYAAHAVLCELFPNQKALFDSVLVERYGFDPAGDGSLEAEIGHDAAGDLMAARRTDGSGQLNGYLAPTDYQPVNVSTDAIVDITRWTPENVPIDPEGGLPDQRFLTPHWGGVDGFALPTGLDGDTDFEGLLPAAPQPFFTEAFAGSTLNIEAKTITLSAAAVIDGVAYAAGDEVPVSKVLIGTVINAAFIAQAEDVVDISANLTDQQKVIAEFWEDGGGSPFPPGTMMCFAQFVSARDDHSIDDDAKMFLAMGNAMLDAGILTWQTKTHYDYARPVRVIRELGELGLIGEWGTDELTGEEGFVVSAWGGIDPVTGEGLGTRTILAANFVTYQKQSGPPSPPFSEYTSGHSAFSAAGAAVLRLFTGSDEFGGSVTFAPGSAAFEPGVPEDELTLFWSTFSEAADEAGISRRYGGIHFEEGDLQGRILGDYAGIHALELALSLAG